MANKLTIAGELVVKTLKKFPSTPILTLAKKLYKENPELFKDIEAVRNLLRSHAGLKGKHNRENIRTNVQREKAFNYNPFNLPESHAHNFEPYIINQSKTLILSDFHFPYQDNKAIEIALNYGLEKKVNCILINGDLLDFAGISRHEKDWRQRTVFQEFEAVRQFLTSLRKHFPTAKIVFKEGNHDERWEKWLFVKAPELFDDPEYKLENRLRLGELKIDIVKDKRPIKIGKLTILHGHELAGGSGGVNPARATFLKTLDSVLVGHYHKRSGHDETTMTGNVISVRSQGCLCGLNPHYMPINKWQHGFGYVEMNLKTGDYLHNNLVIINGKVFQ